jgi:hypothetical protein
MTKNAPATKADLVADAAALGVQVSERLVTDWVEVGLLDAPTRAGAGRGQGSKAALFSANQRRLFTELIQKRTQTRKISQLARIPMYLWVGWGDDYVPTRQARKAFRTWARDTLRVGVKNAQANAIAIVEQVAADNAPQQEVTELTSLLAKIAHQGRLDDAAELENLLDIVVDPQGSNQRLGPPGLQVDAKQYVKSLVRSQVALKHVLDGTLEEDMLLTAREHQRQDLAQYLTQQPLLLTQMTPDQSAKFKIRMEPQDIFDQVCPSLLLIIGALYYPDEGTDVRG